MICCQYCGTQNAENAGYCSCCGAPVSPVKQNSTTSNPSGNAQELIRTLSSRLQINGVIWIVIAVIQILFGLFGAIWTLIVGILNLLSAITDLKNSSRIRVDRKGIVKTYEPITNAIIVLIYNLVIGGVIGVLGSVYYLVFVRGYVMENKAQFLAMEADGTGAVQGQDDGAEHIEIVLSRDEAERGVEKEVRPEGVSSPMRVCIPRRTQDGTTLALHNVTMTGQNGDTVRKTVFIKVRVSSGS